MQRGEVRWGSFLDSPCRFYGLLYVTGSGERITQSVSTDVAGGMSQSIIYRTEPCLSLHDGLSLPLIRPKQRNAYQTRYAPYLMRCPTLGRKLCRAALVRILGKLVVFRITHVAILAMGIPL